ncbi:hypothetical protein SISSUDRAFT_1125575 [Sistotremastrum suecicum HHB10207 ss-3]|uniref:Uncharacterized protein n=1 Tax=Sistotremastrum suecicum HHB10207 ss-3 TaxID=1314776 RepID=A0A166H728_9AGAM|nr:hypothetical protein SISSUDRAFT_1125575 [Sistotremastrum suecicum HHB10207 ss-3]
MSSSALPPLHSLGLPTLPKSTSPVPSLLVSSNDIECDLPRPIQPPSLPSIQIYSRRQASTRLFAHRHRPRNLSLSNSDTSSDGEDCVSVSTVLRNVHISTAIKPSPVRRGTIAPEFISIRAGQKRKFRLVPCPGAKPHVVLMQPRTGADKGTEALLLSGSAISNYVRSKEKLESITRRKTHPYRVVFE